MRVRCVGGIVRDGAGRLLLIERGTPPARGTWSVPGGKVEPGEDDAAALVRELREETGLDVVPGPLVGTVERPGPGGVVFEIHDYAATVAGGALRAGDDAADARWVPLAEVAALPTAPGLLAALRSWGVLPDARPPGGPR
ncbi:NUDIX hydrolase [Actinomadura parmotrematis]|uniref:NUDIX domain-containing protein n=1 Tax=Actinomadura parmotrematis TaxID=2864039 RepID=A0ABS7FLT5_9ACTN|nr:NUDIX domain-containing protein [Actinomadura parmotrematis]MBW8481340.1 NUDIX domain-containing protein [Actinomadura parmotrematis]